MALDIQKTCCFGVDLFKFTPMMSAPKIFNALKMSGLNFY